MAVVRAAPLHAIPPWVAELPVWFPLGAGPPGGSPERACSPFDFAWFPDEPDVAARPPVAIGFVRQKWAAAGLAAEFVLYCRVAEIEAAADPPRGEFVP
jgi:hypothetical protein